MLENINFMQAKSPMFIQQLDIFSTCQVIPKFNPFHRATLFYVALKYRFLTSELSPFLLAKLVGNFPFFSAFRKRFTLRIFVSSLELILFQPSASNSSLANFMLPSRAMFKADILVEINLLSPYS